MADMTQGKQADSIVKFLSKNEILAKNDVTFLEMKVPQWGGTIRFRSLTGDEAIEFGELLKDEETKQAAVIRLFAISVVDELGDRIFDEGDIRLLRRKSWAVFLKAQRRLLDFNGYTEKGTVETKNA